MTTIRTSWRVGALARRRAGTGLRRRRRPKIEFFFPVPVDGKLAREMTRLVKVYNESQKEVEVDRRLYRRLRRHQAQGAGRHQGRQAAGGRADERQLQRRSQALGRHPCRSSRCSRPTARRATQFLGDFWPALHANAVVDGELYGVPFHNSTPLLYYNVDHFKEAGLDPDKPPRTWAELVDAAKKLTKREGDRSRAGAS